MPYAVTLIDKAIHSCGSAAELARKMGIDRAEISKLHKGTRPLSPELAAELADIAGEDAREAAISAIIERNADGRKGHLLKEILGKVLAAGEGEALDSSYSGALISGSKTSLPTSQFVKHRIHRIYPNLCQIGAALRQALALDPQRLARVF